MDNISPVVKREKRWQLIKYCPECNEELKGDNSMISPLRCSCGVWYQILGKFQKYHIVSEEEYRKDWELGGYGEKETKS